MSGSGGILGGITSLLFGKAPSPSFKAPAVEAPAPAAPSRKVDTGAMVRTGTDAAERVKNQRVGVTSSSSRTLSALGSLGRGSGLNI
jgi:hypothetical protein